MHRILSTALLTLILCSLILSACGSARRTPQPTAPVLVTAVPTASATAPVPTRTPSASQTPRPAGTSTPNNPTNSPTETPVTPTATPFPASTPESGPEAYRLKPWDYRTAFRLFDESESVSLAEEYEDMREFYQLSMLYEIYLKMPEYKTDRDLLWKMARLKGLDYSYVPTYGLLHDYSVEPFRQILEDALNSSEVSLLSLELWIEENQAGYIDPIVDSSRLFDQSTDASIVKVATSNVWDFFIIRQDGSGSFIVFALYPEWEQYWWSDETFQVTDLNANGRDEITVEYTGWGTGSSHFCDQMVKVYEWNGSTFENMMGEELLVSTGTDYGDCLPFAYPPDPMGGQMIQTGTSLYTACQDVPYEERVTFRWDGKKFRKEPGKIISEPEPGRIDRCTVDWAVKAGHENDLAVRLLESALKNWPDEANQDWGPAGQDYLRLKLAVWYIQRGQVDKGLALLQEARDHPFTPDYPLSAKVAETFLRAFESGGIQRAVSEVHALYSDELKPFCGDFGCRAEEVRDNFGFFEQRQSYWWTGGASFLNDFSSIDSLALSLQEAQPGSLNKAIDWLERNKRHVVWSIQGDMDGVGEEDWLVELNNSQFFAFLRSKGQIKLVEIWEIVRNIDEPNNIRVWKSYRPSPDAPPVNMIQVGSNLNAFRLLPDGENYKVEIDLSPRTISGFSREDPVETLSWSIDQGRLFVQYEGREAVYAWDASQKKLVPTGFAPDLQDENIGKVEQAIYFDNKPTQAIEILEGMLSARIWENYIWSSGVGLTNPPRVRPYALYLLGLAYEQAGDSDNAVRAYWQLWHDYPTNPYSIAAQSKLERK